MALNAGEIYYFNLLTTEIRLKTVYARRVMLVVIEF